MAKAKNVKAAAPKKVKAATPKKVKAAAPKVKPVGEKKVTKKGGKKTGRKLNLSDEDLAIRLANMKRGQLEKKVSLSLFRLEYVRIPNLTCE